MIKKLLFSSFFSIVIAFPVFSEEPASSSVKGKACVDVYSQGKDRNKSSDGCTVGYFLAGGGGGGFITFGLLTGSMIGAAPLGAVFICTGTVIAVKSLMTREVYKKTVGALNYAINNDDKDYNAFQWMTNRIKNRMKILCRLTDTVVTEEKVKAAIRDMDNSGLLCVFDQKNIDNGVLIFKPNSLRDATSLQLLVNSSGKTALDPKDGSALGRCGGLLAEDMKKEMLSVDDEPNN